MVGRFGGCGVRWNSGVLLEFCSWIGGGEMFVGGWRESRELRRVDFSLELVRIGSTEDEWAGHLETWYRIS